MDDLAVWLKLSVLQDFGLAIACVLGFSSVAMRQNSKVGPVGKRKLDTSDTEIQILVKKIRNGDVGLVRGADLLMGLLDDAGMTYRMWINPRQVGVDPINRDSLGLVLEEVMRLLEDIIFIGWSWEAVGTRSAWRQPLALGTWRSSTRTSWRVRIS